MWILDNRITSGRLRQISRLFSIGHLESASMTLDGAPPKKFDRWYCKADILTIIDNCKKRRRLNAVASPTPRDLTSYSTKWD